MNYFRDTEHLYSVFDTFFRRVAAQEDLANAMLAGKFILRMRYRDPEAQINDPTYGSHAYQAVGMPALPQTKKIYNDAHDVRGHPYFVPLASRVQLTLKSTDVEVDIDAILAYVESL